MKCLMLAFTLTVSISVSLIASATSQDCSNPACTQQLLACKSLKVKQTYGLTLNTLTASQYIGGTQCCDPTTVQEICGAAGSGKRKRQAYNFAQNPAKQWILPIPYMFTTNITAAWQGVIQNTMSYMQSQTCLKFTQITEPSTKPYFTIDTGSNCVAFVGRNNATVTPVVATPDCLGNTGQMMYLLAQLSGLFQENQRPDSTSYISINTANVDPAHLGDFMTIPPSILTTYGLPYDLSSLMHLPSEQFSDDSLITIITKDPLFQKTIGQRVQLSFLDSKLINLMYNCSALCSSYPALSCLNGGYQDPNACTTCRCPDGFAGTLCDATDQPGTCSAILTATPTPQVITSPGYITPGYYGSQQKCVFQINAPLGGQIQLQFVGAFGVYCYEDETCYHWVEIRYATPLNNTGPRFCCGTLPTAVINSTGTQALVIFESNDTITDNTQLRGFQLQYKVINAPACAYITCLNSGVCQNGVCTCTAGWTGTTCQTAVAPTPPTGVCAPNPCHNNGNCTLSATSPLGFTCTCQLGLSGPLCQTGACGGCNANPLLPQSMCTMNAIPYQLCNSAGGSGTSTEYSFFGMFFRKKRNARGRVKQKPCTVNFCCDNAQLIGPPGLQACAVGGWSNWTACSSTCGGGITQRYNISIQPVYQRRYNLAYNESVIVNTQTNICNTQPCVCPAQQSSWYQSWWCRAPACTACNNGFTSQSGACVSNVPLSSLGGSGSPSSGSGSPSSGSVSPQ